MPSFQVNGVWAAMSEVIENLYICGVSALKPSCVIALNFDLIVNCTKEVPNMNLPPDVERLKLWLDDTEDTDLASSLHLAVDNIKMILDADGRVLVHCLAGVSRSAAVCMAYLIKYESMSLRQAYEHLAARRPRVRPNLGFWRQLIDFESEITHEISVKIVKTNRDDQELPDVYENVNDDESITTISPQAILDKIQEEEACKSNRSREERKKRQRQLSDGENGKRFVPKLEPVVESEP